MSTTTAKKLDLVQKLLAKAESTTPEEAEALTEAAERLMVKHGIDQAMIEAKRAANAAPEKVVEERIRFKTQYANGLVSMAASVVDAFGTLRILQGGNRRDRYVYLIGFESDVAQVKLLLESLHLQAFAAMSEWWRNYDLKAGMTPTAAFIAKRQFLVSFGAGAADRIRSAKQEAVQETTGSELALRDRRTEVDDQLGQMYPNLRSSRGGMNGSYHGREEGRAAGRAANTGGTPLRGSSVALEA